MGVIHKLHPDVAGFIISNKKSDPTLGCRQLAEMVQREMRVKVSKSSVNNLLKSESLSGSVGRKRIRAAPAKAVKTLPEITKDIFEIPPVKKQQILDNLKKAKSVLSVHADSSEAVDQKRKRDMIPSVSAASETLRPPVLDRASFDGMSVDFGRDIPSNEQLHAGVGMIFLKAAQWSATSKSIWPQIFEKNGGVDDDNLALYGDFECLSKIIGGQDAPEADFKKNTLYFLNGLKPEHGKEAAAFNKPLKAVSRFVCEMEAQLASTQIKAIQIILKNGQSLWVDPQMVMMSGANAGRCRFSLPMAQAIKVVSRRWISQQQPIIFFITPDADGVEFVFRLHDACENRTGFGFLTATFFDDNQNQAFVSPPFPEHKRIYIIGLWSWQDDCCLWLAEGGKETSFKKNQFSITFHRRHLDEMQKIYYNPLKTEVGIQDYNVISVDNTTGFERKQRSIAVFKDHRMLWGLLTNDFESSPDALMTTYLERWPNGDAVLFKDIKQSISSAYGNIKKHDVSQKSFDWDKPEPAEDEVFGRFGEIFLSVTAKTFFSSEAQPIDPKRDARYFFDVAGCAFVSKERLEVVLRPQSSHVLRSSLKAAATILNEMDIVDWQGRRIRVDIQDS